MGWATSNLRPATHHPSYTPLHEGVSIVAARDGVVRGALSTTISIMIRGLRRFYEQLVVLVVPSLNKSQTVRFLLR
jgi:hypothetical protein